MADQRSVMKEFRLLDHKRRAGGLTPAEEARHAKLRDLIGPELGAGGLGGGFDVNAAAARLRESLMPAGLRNRPPPTPELAPEPEPEPLDLGPLGDPAIEPFAAAPAQVAEAQLAPAETAPADDWFDPASLGLDPPAGDPGLAAQGEDPGAYGAWDPAAAQAATDAAAYGDAGAAQPWDGQAYDPAAGGIDPGASDPTQMFDPASLALDDADPAARGDGAALDPNAVALGGDAAAYPGYPEGAWDPAQPFDPASLAAGGVDPAAGRQATIIDPNVDPAAQALDPAGAPYDPVQPLDPAALSLDPGTAEASWDMAALDLGEAGEPLDEAAPDTGGAFDAAPVAQDGLGAFDERASAAAGLDPAAFGETDAASGEPTTALDLSGAGADLLAALDAAPQDLAALDAAPQDAVSWDAPWAGAGPDAHGAQDAAAGWLATDGTALGALGLEPEAAAAPATDGGDPSVEPTEMLSLGDAGAAAPLEADAGLLPPHGWQPGPELAAAPADAPRGQYDEDGATTAFALAGSDVDAGLERLLPSDPGPAAGIPADTTQPRLERPATGEYDDTAGFTRTAPTANEAAAGWHPESALDRGFALESGGSFAAKAPGRKMGSAPLPWEVPAGAPAAAPAAPSEELPTIDGEEILEEIPIDDTAFAPPSLDFDAPPAPTAPRAATLPAAAAPAPVVKPFPPIAPAAPPRPSAPVTPIAPAAAPRPSAPVAPIAPIAPLKPSPAPAAKAPPSASGAAVTGAHRVVVHTVEGQVKRGLLEDADLAAGALALLPQPGGAPESLPTDRVKAIFFMLALGETPPAPDGKRVRVTFKDGRQIAGFSPDYREGGAGFFMIPADTRTNTGRIWVYRAAVKQVTVT